MWHYVEMKERADRIQHTLQGVPPDVNRVLRQKAARRKKSFNQAARGELSAAAIGGKRKADCSDRVGGWMPDPVFEAILAAQREIDADKWK